MTTTIRLEELYNAYLGLDRLGQREGIKAAPSWWIASTLKKWRADHDTYVERRQVLLEKYGERIPAPDNSGREMWSVKIGREADFHDEHQPLLDMPVEIAVTPHSLTWLGGGIAGAIEPDIAYRLRFLLEQPKIDPKQRIELERGDVDEAYNALASIATFRMGESLAWWFADMLGQAERITKATGRKRQVLLDSLCVITDGKRVTTPEYRKANDTLGKEPVEFFFTSLPFTDLGDLIEKWPPAMLTPILFAFTEPAEGDDAPAMPGLPRP